MKLQKLEIKNFHGIEECEIVFHDFTSIIGQNNCGKSTVLRAIEVLLNQIKPDLDEWRRGFENEDITIIGEFVDIKDWERDIQGIAGLINNNKIKLKYSASCSEGKSQISYEAYVQQVTIEGWSNSWTGLSDQIKEYAAEINLGNGTSFRSKANKERIQQHIKDNYPEIVTIGDEIWTSESISILPALKQGLPQIVFIPAVKDANDEMKGTAKTSFGILINKLILPAIEQTDEYQKVIEAVSNLSGKLSAESEEEQVQVISELMNEISDRLSTIISARALLLMNPPDTNKLVGSNTVLRLNDGTETSINHQGHGMQRSFLFALIETLANREANNIGTEDDHVRSSILLFEEPELYLHPHLMRRLKIALKNISDSDTWQVAISTHSPVLIDVVDLPQSLVIMKKEASNLPPNIFQLDSNPFEEENMQNEREALRASLDFHPTVNEAFFAQRVVLVEGDTEMALFHHRSKPYRKFGISDEQFDHTTIISCGGKWTIPPIAKLLCHYSIPFRIIHDIDRKGRTQQELDGCHHIDPYRANVKIAHHAQGNSIYQVDDTFEHVLWDREQPIPSSKGKPFGTWKKIDDYLDEKSEVSIHDEETLEGIFNFAYNW